MLVKFLTSAFFFQKADFTETVKHFFFFSSLTVLNEPRQERIPRMIKLGNSVVLAFKILILVPGKMLIKFLYKKTCLDQ